MPQLTWSQIWLLLENVPLFNLIFLFAAIASIVLAYYFYYRGQRRRLPVYSVRSNNLVENNIGKIGEVEILYAGSKVQNLSVARVAFWNKGQETINSSDVAPSDPVRIVCLAPAVFLGLEIIYSKTKANNFTLFPIPLENNPREHKQNELIINFDYFDKNEGVIFQIFHTGKTSDSIAIKGTIKGYGCIEKLADPVISKIRPISLYVDNLKRKHKKIFLGCLLILTPMLASITILLPIRQIDNNIFIFYKYGSLVLITALYWSVAFSFLRKRLPRGFEQFDEELRP